MGDFHAFRWPEGVDSEAVTRWFLRRNEDVLDASTGTVISCSHFLPRIDVMPDDIPQNHRLLYPVLGAAQLDGHVRRLNAAVHVYGHSHVNRDVVLDGTRYINNALGYPTERLGLVVY